MKPKYKTGNVCTLDPKNEFYRQGASGYNTVVVEKCIGRKRLFGEYWYNVIGVDVNGSSSDPFEVPERVLCDTNVAVVRIPDNIPVVNNADIEALKYVIAMMKNEIPEVTMRRLVALKDKLDYYNNTGIVKEEII